MSESFVRNFTHLIIPAEIWLRKDISIQAKALWAEIRSMHDKKTGACFASDEYLMEFMQIKRSRLHEVLAELKKVGLLQIISFDGRKAHRRAIVPETEYIEETGRQPSGIPDQENISNPENRTPEFRDPGFGTTYIDRKAYRKDNTPPNPQKGEVCVKFGSHVKFKPGEYEKLIEEHGKALIDELITEMTDYCLASKPEGYKDYAAALRQWIRKRKKNPVSSNNYIKEIDRSTKDINGNPVENPYKGVF